MFSYTFERLAPHLQLCTTPEHKFGTDAFLLSDFSAPRRKDRVCDLGSGCGIIPALWFRRAQDTPYMAYAVEIQQQAYEQMQISREQGGLDERFIPVHADLKTLPNQQVPGSLDLVTCNPPYKICGTGIMSTGQADQIARHETMCTFDDICMAAKRLLKYGGRFCICLRPERLMDAMAAMRNHDMEPKRLRFVHQRPDRAPWLFLLEGKLGASPYLQVMAPLIVEGEGGFSPEMLRIYQKEHNI